MAIRDLIPYKKGNVPWNKDKHIRNNDCLIEYRKTHGVWNKGKRLSEEHRAKLKGPRLNVRGSKHHNWAGGKGTLRHKLMTQVEYISWREKVFERDNYTCQKCGTKETYLMAHHRKSWSEYPGLRYVLSNGVTLCKECHAKVDKYYAKFYEGSQLI